MNTLYILNFNNYFNRQVMKFDNLVDYEEYMLGYPMTGIGFNPNDGITAEQTINWDPTNGNGNYLLVIDNATGEIASRWFIMEAARTRAGQYQLMLRRDLMADFYDDYINAPCFIEKATLSAANPLLFNRENMTYNQIKQSEHLLKDETKSAWIVGYIPRDSFPSGTSLNLQTPATSDSADITVAGIANWEYYRYCENLNPTFTGFKKYPASNEVRLTTKVAGLVDVQNVGGGVSVIDGRADIGTDIYGNYNNSNSALITGFSQQPLTINTKIGAYRQSNQTSVLYPDVCGEITKNYSTVSDQILSKAASLMNTLSNTASNKIMALDNKIIYDTSNQKAYNIVINRNPSPEGEWTITQGTPLFITLSGALNREFYIGNIRATLTGTPDSDTFSLNGPTTSYTISLIETVSVNTSV